MYTQTLNLNLISRGIKPVIHVSQFDNQVNAFIFKLFYGDTVYSIPNNVAVLFNGLKPDGTVFSFAARSYSGNTVYCDCDQQVTAVDGDVECELRIRSATEIIGTINFLIRVEKSPLNNDSVISETMIPLIEQAVDIAANLAEYIETTLDARNEAVESAETATQKAGEASVYNNNVEQTYNALEGVKQAANTAAASARSIATELQNKLDSGYFKGDKGDKGDPGESGVVTPINGLFAMTVEPNGDLYIYSDDSNDIAENFEYDSETGNLNYLFVYTEPEPEPDPEPESDPEESQGGN